MKANEGKMKIAIIGLGYVGLPLAAAFAAKHEVVGFDVCLERIEELRGGHDRTLELSDEELAAAIQNGLKFSAKLDDMRQSNFYIVCVPTPVDRLNRPDLTPLIKASESVGAVLKKGDIVVYESTVYPGATEEDCVPVLERASGLKFNRDFFCGYSPERINPGDKIHTVTKIKKIVSASTPEALDVVDSVYLSILQNGTFRASSIKVAEAAKVIENTQRDINIGFINELAILFGKLGINTNDVIDAAATKWNFLSFRPGLVGGHCIGVDPYYFIYKAQNLGYHSQLISTGRRINDDMSGFVAHAVVREIVRAKVDLAKAHVHLFGMAFKENCPDTRNSRAADVYRILQEYDLTLAAIDTEVDWAIKRRLMRAQRERHPQLSGQSLETLRSRVDLAYHDLNAEAGLVPRLVAEGAMVNLCEPEEIERARHTPPATRAALRGAFVAACLEVGADFSVSWESLRLDSPPTAPVDLPDPLETAHEAAESLTQRVLGLRPEDMHRIDLVGRGGLGAPG